MEQMDGFIKSECGLGSQRSPHHMHRTIHNSRRNDNTVQQVRQNSHKKPKTKLTEYSTKGEHDLKTHASSLDGNNLNAQRKEPRLSGQETSYISKTAQR